MKRTLISLALLVGIFPLASYVESEAVAVPPVTESAMLAEPDAAFICPWWHPEPEECPFCILIAEQQINPSCARCWYEDGSVWVFCEAAMADQERVIR